MMADDLHETRLREDVSEILKNGDLAILTSKKIRQILEKKYEMNLLDRKKQIDDIVMKLVDEQSDDSDDPSVESASKSDSGKTVMKSSKEVPVISITTEDKLKMKKENDLDESDSDNGYEADTRKSKRKSPGKRPAPKSKSKATKKVKTESGGEKKKTGFLIPKLLSPELAALMGETHMARSDVVKKMWQIIKERNLMDPKNKRYTICDDQLEKIIGQRRFLTFSMMKYLKKHVRDPGLM